jgi:hypothetical protein
MPERQASERRRRWSNWRAFLLLALVLLLGLAFFGFVVSVH